MRIVTDPEDAANAAWFLGSEQSSFVTGTTLEVCQVLVLDLLKFVRETDRMAVG